MSGLNKDRRATFRVAVRPGSGLDAAFVINGQVHMARAANLSAHGIFVRPIDQKSTPRLAAGDTVMVELKYEDKDLLLSGLVCSRRDGGYGIHFPRQDREGYQNPRDQLSSIVTDLQREPIAQHIQMLKLPGEDK